MNLKCSNKQQKRKSVPNAFGQHLLFIDLLTEHFKYLKIFCIVMLNDREFYRKENLCLVQVKCLICVICYNI
jgi:hypothetical protein